MTIVFFVWLISLLRSSISSADSLSKSPVGSSATIKDGADTKARAMATRCSCPPESSLGK